MKDIKDPVLKEWAAKHVELSIEKRRAAKAGWRDLEDLWDSWDEKTWGDFRELLHWRGVAREKKLEKHEIELGVQRRLAKLPRVNVNGIEYAAPYTFSVEVEFLRNRLEGNLLGPHVELIL